MDPLVNVTNQIEDLKENFNDFFLVTNGIVVSFMQAGFACLEAGAVRTKNTTNIMMINILDLCICAVAYFLIGFPLAYGDGGPYLGYSSWAQIPESREAYWFFQFIFAATATTILAGAVAERCNFTAYIIYSFIICGITYPVASHWAWSEEGWLVGMGFKDFSGSGVLHALAGVCSFVAAAFLGPRRDRFPGEPIPGHSLPLVGLGALLLISGFLAFNAGSLGHITQPHDGSIIATSAMNTIFGGSGGAIVGLIVGRLISSGSWPFSYTANAVLAGMVSVCGGLEVYTSFACIIVGLIGALVYTLLHYVIIYLRVDDPLDASPLHFGAGAWGIIARPFFSKEGFLYGHPNSVKLLLGNLGGLALIIIWSAMNSIIIFGALKMTRLLRVSEEEELKGIDLTKHGEISYPISAWNWSESDNVETGLEMNKTANGGRSNYVNYGFETDRKL